ncbi:MAG: 4-amino-4-deoxy-L-arabinose transferase [Leptonema sp. (in: Bacteria)]|nr:4-amino-4-deoxy-L-arabinose transferase [Leptonema sp. (in: bacteria)]
MIIKPALMWSFLGLAILLGAIGQILMKVGMKQAGPIPLNDGVIILAQYFLKALTSPPLLGVVFCYGVSILLWLAVLSVEDLSLVRPLMSIGYILTLLYGVYSGESVTIERIGGTLLITGGVFLLVR